MIEKLFREIGSGFIHSLLGVHRSAQAIERAGLVSATLNAKAIKTRDEMYINPIGHHETAI